MSRRTGIGRAILCISTTWLIGLAAIIFARYRGTIPVYTDFHQWLADLGLPQPVRNIDLFFLFLGGTAIGGVIAARLSGRTFRDVLRLNQPAMPRAGRCSSSHPCPSSSPASPSD